MTYTFTIDLENPDISKIGELSKDFILSLEECRLLDVIIGKYNFNIHTIGYYAPKLPYTGKHTDSYRYNIRKEAQDIYEYNVYPYLTEKYKDTTYNYYRNLEDESQLCYWQENWGPICLDDYILLEDSWKILEDKNSLFKNLRNLSSHVGNDYCLYRKYPDTDKHYLTYMTPSGEKTGPMAKSASMAIIRAALDYILKDNKNNTICLKE